MPQTTEEKNLAALLQNRWWRLNNLYYVTNEKGEKVKFIPRKVQQQFLDDMHYLSIILKARQLGLTTLIDIYILDAVLFNSNKSGGIIAHTLHDAKKIFTNKIRFAYENLPSWLLDTPEFKIVADNAMEIRFGNGSSIYVGTSMRSGTLQYLHVSELGKIAKRNPDKATEIKSGAFNTVHEGQFIFVESTAEGRAGLFFDMCQVAKAAMEESRPLSKMEFKFFFFPWFDDVTYRSDSEVVFTALEKAYFRKLENEHGIYLDREQQAWYVEKWRLNKLGSEDTMLREYPSTPEEAFEAQIKGAYYATQISEARQQNRICGVPYDPALLVNTFWDLGRNDSNAIWFHQRVGKENRFIDYIENNGEGIAYYARLLKERGYVYDQHYLPHDANVIEYTRSDNKTRKEVLQGMVQGRVNVVPRIESVSDGIEQTRNVLNTCWFDKSKCDEGLKALEAYRKQWDEKRQEYRDNPYHDWASNGADAFRQFAQNYKSTKRQIEHRPPRPRR